jgi:hypothetical protein
MIIQPAPPGQQQPPPDQQQPPSPPRPAVDDRFWFERSGEMVKNAVTNRNDAGDKLQATIGWFWTAYTAAAVVGFAVTEKDYPDWAVLLMAVPVVPLLFAYWWAGYVRVPIEVSFDRRIPSEIEESYYKTVTTKKNRLKLAVVFSVVAGLAVVMAILVAALAADEKKEAGSFEAAFNDKPRREIVVGGSFAAGTRVLLSIKPKDGAEMTPNAYVVSDTGELHRTYGVPVAEEYGVTATWDEEKVGTRSLKRMVKGTAPKETAAQGPMVAPLEQIRRILKRLLKLELEDTER